MGLAADAERTKKKDQSYIRYYFKFCKIKKLHTLQFVREMTPEKMMGRYLGWLYWEKTFKGKDIPHGVAKACLTAVGKYWNDNGLTFVRKNHPAITRKLIGYKKWRPSLKRARKPWCLNHMKLAMKVLLKAKTELALTLAACLAVGYWWGCRVGEYTSSPSTIALGDIPLRFKHLAWFYDKNGTLLSVAIKIEKSKCNQYGEKNETLPVDCTCKVHGKATCGPHLLQKLCRAKVRSKGRNLKRNDLIFEKSHKKAMTPDCINNTLEVLANQMGLKGSEYRSHSLRIGRATDLARSNMRDAGPPIAGRRFMSG